MSWSPRIAYQHENIGIGPAHNKSICRDYSCNYKQGFTLHLLFGTFIDTFFDHFSTSYLVGRGEGVTSTATATEECQLRAVRAFVVNQWCV